jgi:hypothetical protein
VRKRERKRERETERERERVFQVAKIIGQSHPFPSLIFPFKVLIFHI